MFLLNIKFVKFNNKIFLPFILLIATISLLFFYSFANDDEVSNDDEKSNDFIKWVDFSVTVDALNDTSKLDIDSHNSNEGNTYNWIELLSYLACKNGGNFKNYKSSDLTALKEKLDSGQSMEDLTKDFKLYNYYMESYTAVLGRFIGNYSVETVNQDGSKSFSQKYGLKAFLPIAKNYNFSHYDDFGNSRSYGFKRTHLGNDLLRKYWYSCYCC